MSELQDDSGVALYGVTIDPASYEESRAALYVYRQRRGEASHTGVVCDVTMQAIADGRVRGHEAIHQLRVDALLWHHARSETPPALVMLLHREGPEFQRAVEQAQQREPVLDFEGPLGFQQTVWRLGDEPTTSALAAELAGKDLYIADGHHRTAAALEEWRVAGKPPEAGLLCVVHPMDGLRLSAFHRRVSGPLDAARLLALLGAEFDVRETGTPPVPSVGWMGLYVASHWYVVGISGLRPNGVLGLDASILESRLLERLDPAAPGRVRVIDTIPAAEPLDGLVARCDADRGALFTLAPPPPEALVEVADAGEVMPPKTTYFEPKPAAGVFLRA